MQRWNSKPEFLRWTESGDWRSLLQAEGWTRISAVPLKTPEDFAAWFSATGLNHQPYLHGSSPRWSVLPGIYTSTEAPARWPVPLHCEMSYTSTPPRYVAFFCQHATRQGGATPLADMRAVTAAIGADLCAEFEEKGVTNFRVLPKFVRWPYLTSWPRVYGTTDKDRVYEVCHETDHQARFTPWGDLVLSNRQAALREMAGQKIWFNQLTVFHRSFHQELAYWQMPWRAQAHRYYRHFADFGAPVVAYPFDARYGDGTRILDETLLTVRQAHWQAMRQDPWQTGDLLVIDNWRVAHGRAPFAGKRRVLVAMGS